MNTFTLACQLFSMGFNLLPVVNKKPRVKWKRLQTERNTQQELKEWFLFNDFGIGLITGSLSGLVAVDIDDAAALKWFKKVTGDVLSPMFQKTNSGCHFLYRHPRSVWKNRQRVNGLRLDVRGDGGFIAIYDDAHNWTSDIFNAAPVMGGVVSDVLQKKVEFHGE